MELIVFGAIAIGVVYVLYKVYGPKDSAPTVTVAEVVAKAETVVAEATVEETFPNKFGMYDLPKFLGMISNNVDNKASPDLTFEKDFFLCNHSLNAYPTFQRVAI